MISWAVVVLRILLLFHAAILFAYTGTRSSAQTPRESISLDGSWEMQLDGDDQWREVIVPGTFEEQLSVDFDGVATFRKRVEPGSLQGKRLLLHFDGVATEATVWFNDQPVGQHLGAWTPFRCDVTEAASDRPDGPWEIRVRVDEKVGHNTQGFLPIIAPHFGGIWQSVDLITVPRVYIDELRLQAYGNIQAGAVRISFPIEHYDDISKGHISVGVRNPGDEEWTRFPDRPLPRVIGGGFGARDDIDPGPPDGDLDLPFEPFNLQRLSFEIPHPVVWTPDNPRMYDVRIEIRGVDDDQQPFSHVVDSRFAFRTATCEGTQLKVNGMPWVVRGVLNWGYAPPRTAPSLDEAFMRREIQFAKDRGFNLMKFCLWIPPKRYLELCDELGMLAWMEYPAWHPDFSADQLGDLKVEYDEFFCYDRNHPSVILRSLTCETGPSADIEVIRELYKHCKYCIPGAIVVDDSSWIAWNRVHDFYDDHPYGNNHTWVATLERLNDHIAERVAKPLILGEAIAADTWLSADQIPASNSGDEPFWWPGFLQDNRRWEAQARKLYGDDAVERLTEDSKHYALLMRKFQIEAFQRQVPDGGYVVSVIRDFPLASMGMIDFLDRDKWPADTWSWHGDTMLILNTENDRRSFFASGEPESGSVAFQILVKTPARSPVVPAELQVKYGDSILSSVPVQLDSRQLQTLSFAAGVALPENVGPQRRVISASLVDAKTKRLIAANTWPIWIVPDAGSTADDPRDSSTSFPKLSGKSICVHASAIELREHFSEDLETFHEAAAVAAGKAVLTRRLDRSLLNHMERGGNVILLPDNSRGSLELKTHWFLRGGPVITSLSKWITDGKGASPATLRDVPREMLVELQHFDLAGDVIPDISYIESIHPLLMLWENHDIRTVRTNALLFHMPVGAGGHLYVSALDHFGTGNAAGRYLLDSLIQGVGDGRVLRGLPTLDCGLANLERLGRELNQKSLPLESRTWQFSPDEDRIGEIAQWHSPAFDDSNWKTITADRHWEAQGFDSLDQWAWYRLKIEIPADWPASRAFLNFTGVDDYYDLFVNGVKIGSGGNIEERETAFDERQSHDISHLAQPGESIQIAVAVFDWYGAGGIFRPVTLSTAPLSSAPPILK